MGLVGSLEDLSFPDILQVIHVSRQSGTLILGSPLGERRVLFRNGLVCGATLAEGRTLEDLLVERGHITAEALAAAQRRQGESGGLLAATLVASGSVAQDVLERVVRDELRGLLRSLVLLQEGEFRFEIVPDGEAGGAGIGLPEGLAPDSILLPGDPRRAPSPGGREATSQAAFVERRRVPRRVLLVVDRAVVRFALKDDLVRRRFQVEACATPTSALELARSLARRGMSFFLICDLLLPDASGKGWRGGLDLVREIVRLAPGTPALMVGELRDAAARDAARAAGALGYLALPDLGAADLQAVGGRVAEFCSQVRAVLRDPQGFGADGGASAPGPVRVVDHLSLLRGLIGELHAEEEVEIPLLVLRLAAEYFERAVLFSVRGAEAHGVGAFGESLDGGPGLDDRVRGAALPLMRGSLLQRAVHGRASYVGPIARSRPDAALIERLGPPAPEEAALLPITGGAHAFGVLYGDNATSRRPIGDLRGLEIFLAQAGSALRNAALQRRLEASGGRASGGAGSHG